MKKWIIYWNAGYGADYEIVEAETQQKAVDIAYDAWRDSAESNADYGAKPYDKELAENLGLE